jgi:tRNA nucleotidyltransferase/poly(A) polymerase
MITIDLQKIVADDVLEKLFSIDPHAIVAGGAPRDWFMGNLASDIDVFFCTRHGISISTVKRQLEHVGFVIESTKTGKNLPAHYKKNPMLKCLLAVFKGLTCSLWLCMSLRLGV